MAHKVDSVYEALIDALILTVTKEGAEHLTTELEMRGWQYIGQPRGPFQTVELFPPMPMSGSPVSDCTECGAYVKMLQQHKHTTWHNKVADL